MTVSNYLEAFLSVYGWAVYYTFFLLIGVTGLFLYPMLRSLLTILTEYLSGEGYDGIGYLKQAFVILALNMLVFFLALVPVVQISFDKMEVNNICGKDSRSVSQQNDLNGLNGKKYFTLSEVRVPLLPWLAMRLGQGMNAVIYKQLPCALHTGDANKTVLTLETNDQSLDDEFAAFINQCHRPAVAKIKEILEGRYDQKVNDNGKTAAWMKAELDKMASQTKLDKESLINFVDSPFIRKYIYSDESSFIDDPSVKEVLGGIPRSMNAKSAVAGFKGKFGVNDGIPSCYGWWLSGEGDVNKGLRARLIKSLSDDAVLKVSQNSKIPECKEKFTYIDNGFGATPMPDGVENKEACLAKIREKAARPVSSGGLYEQEGSTDRLVYTMLAGFQGGKTHEKEGVLTTGENAVFSLFTLAGAAALALFRTFGLDLASGALSAITSFYATIYMLKIMLRFLVPMIIMVIYMSWGIYVLIGEMRGSTVVKGMLTIFSATIIFGLWSIADHIDDKLWDAMYGSRWGSPFAMILLDATSGIFYIIIFSVVFYMVNLAGGGDSSGLFSGGQKQSTDLSQGIGKGTTGRSFGVGSWLFSGAKNNKGDYTGGWGRQWAGKGWEKVKGTSSKISFNIKESYKGVKSRLGGLRNKE